jgi:hypothetical protein
MHADWPERNDRDLDALHGHSIGHEFIFEGHQPCIQFGDRLAVH